MQFFCPSQVNVLSRGRATCSSALWRCSCSASAWASARRDTSRATATTIRCASDNQESRLTPTRRTTRSTSSTKANSNNSSQRRRRSCRSSRFVDRARASCCCCSFSHCESRRHCRFFDLRATLCALLLAAGDDDAFVNGGKKAGLEYRAKLRFLIFSRAIGWWLHVGRPMLMILSFEYKWWVRLLGIMLAFLFECFLRRRDENKWCLFWSKLRVPNSIKRASIVACANQCRLLYRV